VLYQVPTLKPTQRHVRIPSASVLEHQQHGQQCCAVHATAGSCVIWSGCCCKWAPLLQAKVRYWHLGHLFTKLTTFPSELIYPRNVPVDARTNVPSPRQFGISDFEDLQIPTPDGESLHALFLRQRPTRFSRNLTVLMFHGNAGNIGHRVPIAKALQDTLQCNVLLLEYRGYGMSTGTPDEAGLKIDAQTGLDYLRQRPETMDTDIIVYGQSLGGAVAINLVASNEEQGDIGGLILENTFLSIRKLIPKYVFELTARLPGEQY
jgi:hypothetical protein